MSRQSNNSRFDVNNPSIKGLETYFNTEFSSDVKKLRFQKPNNVILSNPACFGVDEQTVFFGEKDWKYIEHDLSSISPGKKEYFVICLFTIVLIDLTMFTYFKDQYSVYRKKTNYPKFGWTGFGPHFENPKTIILLPEQLNMVDFLFLKNNVIGYCKWFSAKCEELFGKSDLSINTLDFIQRTIDDEDFKPTIYDKESVFGLIYTEFKVLIIFGRLFSGGIGI